MLSGMIQNLIPITIFWEKISESSVKKYQKSNFAQDKIKIELNREKKVTLQHYLKAARYDSVLTKSLFCLFLSRYCVSTPKK